jgi:hypothetical protein
MALSPFLRGKVEQNYYKGRALVGQNLHGVDPECRSVEAEQSACTRPGRLVCGQLSLGIPPDALPLQRRDEMAQE